MRAPARFATVFASFATPLKNWTVVPVMVPPQTLNAGSNMNAASRAMFTMSKMWLSKNPPHQLFAVLLPIALLLGYQSKDEKDSLNAEGNKND
ncbi:MAG: hypothetical protein ABSB29_02060 [Nitrososphaerales archaeon]|jgi:hypothetical protein